MDFDKIAASAPVNGTAARQTSGGTHWNPSRRLQDWYDEIPPMRGSEYYADKGTQHHEWVDFRGVEVGRLVVVGTMIKAGTGHASWVCRCKCGCYCTRTAKSIRIGMRGGNSFVPMCGRCYYQRRLASGWSPKPLAAKEPRA